ncbi:MAG: hypothetical protein WBD63_10620, partial [Phycisphaerae bacterium]
FNRSRSFRLIRSSILVLLPATRPERGQFYFAETGHYHFAATGKVKRLTLSLAAITVRGEGRAVERPQGPREEKFMRRIALVGAVAVLGLSGLARAQGDGLDNLHGASSITDSDRQMIRAWLQPRIANLIASTDPELKQMVLARDEIVAEGRSNPSWTPAFIQAYGEEAIAALAEAAKQATSQDARVNILMTVAELRRIEGVPLLTSALVKDPYAASRYWAAKGLDQVADRVVERVLPRAEQEIAAAAKQAFQTESNGLTLTYLFAVLGRFDHEDAHDAVAEGAQQVVMRLAVSDPTVARAIGEASAALAKAYAAEVRPEAKTAILSTYAVLCAWIMPPTGDPNLMATINASLEKITGARVGFAAGTDPLQQKLALVEWIEWLVRNKQIPNRPLLPPAVEKAVETAKRRLSPAPAASAAPTP